MLLQNPSSSRAQWYDRNPMAIWQFFFGNQLAPAVNAQRWSYTVPAGRKCNVENINCRIMRFNAAAPASVILCLTDYTPSGGTQAQLLTSTLLTNGVGDKDAVNGSSAMIMFAGDNIIGQTSDSSTGGTVAFWCSLKGSEYDA